jgi:hypothetical protein
MQWHNRESNPPPSGLCSMVPQPLRYRMPHITTDEIHNLSSVETFRRRQGTIQAVAWFRRWGSDCLRPTCGVRKCADGPQLEWGHTAGRHLAWERHNQYQHRDWNCCTALFCNERINECVTGRTTEQMLNTFRSCHSSTEQWFIVPWRSWVQYACARAGTDFRM